jgi:magnesium-transporting ATPase (P-type)
MELSTKNFILKFTPLRLEKIEGNQKFSLVVDGKTLVDVMDYYSEPFLDICLLCEAVLCCRMSPGQKADVFEINRNKLFFTLKYFEDCPIS